MNIHGMKGLHLGSSGRVGWVVEMDAETDAETDVHMDANRDGDVE